MSKELNIGDYVRHKNGYIGKIIDICKCDMCKERDFYEPILDNNQFYITNLDKANNFEGLKFSANIIDLIEIGDYVNGSKVANIDIDMIYWESGNAIYKDYINSIVTKEQFKEMEYKL